MKTRFFKIQDICTIKSGKRLPAGFDFSLEPTEYRYIRGRDIKSGKISLDNVAYIDKETKKAISKYIINSGDIAITIVANIGDIGFATPDCDGINLTENAVRLTRFNDSVVDSKYLAYYLSQPSMKMHMENLAVGAAQAKLGIYKIEKIKVQLPELSIQKAIVNVIEHYDNLIEVNNRRIKILEQMAENLYKEWFVRFRFPGYETVKFQSGIPNGWKRRRLEEFVHFDRGVSYSSADLIDGGYVLLSMNNVKPYGGFIRDYTRLYSGKFKESQLVRAGDLIMAITDMTQDRRIIGYTGLVSPGSSNRVISMHLLKVSSNEYGNLFLNYLFNYSGLSRTIAEYATGTNVLGMTVDILSRIKTLCPPKSLAIEYERILRPIIQDIHHYEQINDGLKNQRDLLLPRLMNGKLKV